MNRYGMNEVVVVQVSGSIDGTGFGTGYIDLDDGDWTRCGLGWGEGSIEDVDVLAEYSNEFC